MNHWMSKLLGLLTLVFASSYILGFVSSYLYFMGVALFELLNNQDLSIQTLISWVSVGLSLSLLSVLTAWPFALAVATLIEHNKARPLARFCLGFASYLASLPLILFVFVYVQIVGEKGFLAVKSFWLFLFASSNFFTQALSFGLTLLLYPITMIPGVGEGLSIAVFYDRILSTVFEFAEVGLVASVIAMGLFLYVVPKMVLHMRQQLRKDENLRSFQIIKSIGGTPWESIHLTVMQSMKAQFNSIIVDFTRKCFFEGLITFTLLRVFFINDNQPEFHWSSTLSAVFLWTSLFEEPSSSLLRLTAGTLCLSYLLFIFLENYYKKPPEVFDV
jgi:hypothetical protein